MKLLIIQFSPSSCHDVHLNRNILFSTIIKHAESVFSSCGKGLRFTCTKHPELDRCVNFNLLRNTEIGAGLDYVKQEKSLAPTRT